MPNSMIKKDEKRGYGSEKRLEKDWDEAKDAAGKGPGGKPNYRLSNYIYQQKKKSASVIKTDATARLKATQIHAAPSKPVIPNEGPYVIRFKSQGLVFTILTPKNKYGSGQAGQEAHRDRWQHFKTEQEAEQYIKDFLQQGVRKGIKYSVVKDQ